MACWLTTDYKIYAGNNQAGNLALITSYSDTASVAFIEPAGIAYTTRGELVFKSNGVPDYRGFAAIDWIFGWLSYKQWEYAKTNWAGLVTIKAAVNSSTFANFNAVLRLEDPNDMTKENIVEKTYQGLAFINAPFHFTKLEAL